MTDRPTIERYLPLTDMVVRSEAGGNIIDAYAAMFDSPAEIRDRQGHYTETIARTAFDRTISQRGIDSVGVIFNHGKTIHGTPSERFSMPYGKPLAIRADSKGLFTSTEVSRTELGEEILQLVNDGVIKGQSFSGAIYDSKDVPSVQRGSLPTKVRTELGLREYGLTPFPAYEDAQVVAVRADLELLSIEDLCSYMMELHPAERATILESVAAADTGTSETEVSSPVDTDTAAAVERIEREARLREIRLITASL